MQRFKPNEEIEGKVIAAWQPAIDDLNNSRDDFYNGAWTAYMLGDVIYSLDRDPMVGVILPETYRTSFPAIHDLFTQPATFPFYLEVFRSIWGENASIEFQIPDPGHLVVNIAALTLEESPFMARRIVNNVYTYDQVVTHDGDRIMFQTAQGIKSQREADALANELSANGVFTEINLTFE